jgi:hypothetical protein
MQFFANASRWKQLSADEQQLWLKLSGILPPMPPLFPPPPPLPDLSTTANPAH